MFGGGNAWGQNNHQQQQYGFNAANGDPLPSLAEPTTFAALALQQAQLLPPPLPLPLTKVRSTQPACLGFDWIFTPLELRQCFASAASKMPWARQSHLHRRAICRTLFSACESLRFLRASWMACPMFICESQNQEWAWGAHDGLIANLGCSSR